MIQSNPIFNFFFQKKVKKIPMHYRWLRPQRFDLRKIRCMKIFYFVYYFSLRTARLIHRTSILQHRCFPWKRFSLFHSIFCHLNVSWFHWFLHVDVNTAKLFVLNEGNAFPQQLLPAHLMLAETRQQLVPPIPPSPQSPPPPLLYAYFSHSHVPGCA